MPQRLPWTSLSDRHRWSRPRQQRTVLRCWRAVVGRPCSCWPPSLWPSSLAADRAAAHLRRRLDVDTLIHPRRDAKRRTEGNLRLGSIVLLSWLTAIACGSGTTPAPEPTGERD